MRQPELRERRGVGQARPWRGPAAGERLGLCPGAEGVRRDDAPPAGRRVDQDPRPPGEPVAGRACDPEALGGEAGPGARADVGAEVEVDGVRVAVVPEGRRRRRRGRRREARQRVEVDRPAAAERVSAGEAAVADADGARARERTHAQAFVPGSERALVDDATAVVAHAHDVPPALHPGLPRPPRAVDRRAGVLRGACVRAGRGPRDGDVAGVRGRGPRRERHVGRRVARRGGVAERAVAEALRARAPAVGEPEDPGGVDRADGVDVLAPGREAGVEEREGVGRLPGGHPDHAHGR